MRIEKRVDTREKQGIMVNEKKVVHGTNKHPKLLAREGVASTLANVDNVDRIVEDLEEYKKKVSQSEGDFKERKR